MKRLTSLALLGFLLSFVAPASVSATGDCAAAFFWMFNGYGQTGTSAVYCWGVNDNDIEGENIPGITLGPLDDGDYRPDFDTSHTTSGLSSFHFHDDGPGGAYGDYKLCVYSGKAYVGLIVSRSSTSYIDMTGGLNNIAGSFKIINQTASC